MKMQKYASYLMMTVLLTNSLLGVFTASADSLSTVQARVNQIQATDPLLPSGVSEQKGMFGTIIANVFDTAGKIKVEFLGNLVPGLSTNYVPRWSGTNFINSAISDNGTTVVSSRPVQVNSNLKVNGTNSFYLQGNRLYGDNSSALYYYSNHTSASQMEFRDINNVRYGVVYGNGTGANFGLLDGDGNWSYLAAKDNYTDFRINNSSIMTLLSSGNVGVGTTSPSYKFEVSGTTKTSDIIYGNGDSRTQTRDDAGLQGNAGAKSGFFETASPTNYPTGASSWWHMIDVRHSNTSNNYALQIAGSFFDQNLYFRKTNNSASTGWNKIVAENSAGNVGIGNTSPSEKLSVTGNISATGDIKGNRICDNSGNCTSLPLPAITNYWTVNGTNIYNNNSGNVGIGTSTPAAKLQVDSGGWPTIAATNSTGWSTIAMKGNQSQSLVMHYGGDGTNEIRLGRYASNMSTWQANVVRIDMDAPDTSMYLNGSGNMGIGTGSPGYKLDVNGGARFNGTTRIGDGSSANNIQFELQSGFHRIAFNDLRFWDWDTGGDMLRLNNGNIYATGWFFLNANRLYGDGGATTYLDSGDSNVVSMQFRDNEGTRYGHVYGDGNGTSFGLLNSAGAWSYRTWNGGNEIYQTTYATDFRPQIIYDRNDTNYYVDPNGTTRLNTTYHVGNTFLCNGNATGCYTRFSDDGYIQDNNDGLLRFYGNYEFQGSLYLNGNVYDNSSRRIRDAGGGWVRTYGNTGWYNGDYGGGWYMSDTTRLRSYSNKNVYTAGIVRADGGVTTSCVGACGG